MVAEGAIRGQIFTHYSMTYLQVPKMGGRDSNP